MRNVLRYKDAPRASIGESDRRSLFAVGLTDDLMDWKIVSLDFGSSFCGRYTKSAMCSTIVRRFAN